MMIKVSSTGIGTGIALLVVMYYPLYVIFPGNYMVEWSSGSLTLGIAMSFLGVLLLLAGGWVAARIAKTSSRKQGAMLGSVAGTIAGLILYFSLGVAAAGVAGSGNLLVHGPHPASGEEQFLILLAESILRTTVWIHQVFWGLLLGSATLGAIGGALAPPQVPDKSTSTIKPDSQMGCIFAMVALLASGLSLLVTVVIFSLLKQWVHLDDSNVNYSPSIPPASILNWPAGTIMAIFLAVMLCMLLAIRAESTTTSRKRRLAAKVAAYVTAFLLVAIFGLFFLNARDFILNPIFIVGAILSVTMGVQMLRAAIALRQRLRQTSLEAPPDDPAPGILQREYWRSHFFKLSLGIGAALFLPIFVGTVPSLLSFIFIPVRMILVLASYGYPGADSEPVVDFTSRSLVNSMFASQPQISFGIFIVTVVLVSLLILGLMMIGWIVSRLKTMAAVIRNNKKELHISDSAPSLPVSWKSILLAVASVFCLAGAIIGLIIGVVISPCPVEPEPASYTTWPMEFVFIAIAIQEIQEGTIIEQDMIYPMRISPEFVIDTWIVGDDEDDLQTKVEGCQARIDIQRALPLIPTFLDCP